MAHHMRQCESLPFRRISYSSFLCVAIFYQVVRYLLYDVYRDSIRIACIATCWRNKSSVETNQFSIGIYQCSATAAKIYCSVCLYKRFNRILSFVDICESCLDTNNAGGNSNIKMQG